MRRRAVIRNELEDAIHTLDEMEPELQQLAGLIMALRILGEAPDAIEPIAVSAIARAAGSTLDEIERGRRTAMSALGGQ